MDEKAIQILELHLKESKKKGKDHILIQSNSTITLKTKRKRSTLTN